MKLRYKIAGAVLLIAAAGVAALGYGLSHDAACGGVAAIVPGAARMQAVMQRCYGAADVLRVETVARPIPDDDQILVGVRAASVNPLDWHFVRGVPYVLRLSAGMGAPKDGRLGVDFAGVVVAVGRNVTRFKTGDAVFGGSRGAFAQYLRVRANGGVAAMPEGLSFEQAAAVPVAGVTALQALRDQGQLRAGQQVLINGASGGVGTFAVQIAKLLGAHVTAVCSARNAALLRALGADVVIDYTRQDFTAGGVRYDLIVDNVGNHPLGSLRRVLQPSGTYVMVGGPNENTWIGAFTRVVPMMLTAPFSRQRLRFFIASMRPGDLEYLAALMRATKVMPVIDRRYSLAEVAAAIGYVEAGHARGKVIITIPDEHGS
jgi:NADPH:quinone reductase-like Zn-dependent oxidoreductase